MDDVKKDGAEAGGRQEHRPGRPRDAGARRRVRHRDGVQPRRPHEAVPHRRERRLLPHLLHGPLPPGRQGRRGEDRHLRRRHVHHRRPPLRPPGGGRRGRALRPRPRHGHDAARRGQGRGRRLQGQGRAEARARWPATWASPPPAARSTRSRSTWPTRPSSSSASRTARSSTRGAPRPSARRKWRELGLTPRAIDREVVEVMHRTHEGVDLDAENILKSALRCSLADGWGGSMLSTDISDILFGTPSPLSSRGQPRRAQERPGQRHRARPRAHPVGDARRGVARPRAHRRGQGRRRQGHQPGRHLLHQQRDPHALRHPGGRQLPAPGAGRAHRRRRGHGRRRAVHHAGPRPARPALPHEAHHHLAEGQDPRRDARGVRRAPRPRDGRARSCAWRSPTTPTAAPSTSPTTTSRWSPASATSTSTTCRAASTAARSARSTTPSSPAASAAWPASSAATTCASRRTRASSR